MADDNIVEVIYQLRDQMSQVLAKISGETDHANDGLNSYKKTVKETEGTMKSFGNTAKTMMASLGVAFGAYQAFDFVKGGVEKVEELHQAHAQLEATLKSTGNAAGLAREEYEALTNTYKKSTLYGGAEITSMQSVLTTFTGIKGAIYKDAIPAILDLSAKMHQDLQSSAVEVGKALQDPERGITALRRIGVNFNSTQTQMIKNWVKHGEVVRAQTYILKELQTEFRGSAAAAANANPYFKFHKMMEDLKLTVGDLAMKFTTHLMPAIMGFLGKIQSGLSWMKSHKELLIGIASGVGVLSAALAINALRLKAVAWWNGISASAEIFAALCTLNFAKAWDILTISMEANPIGWIIGLISLLVVGIVYFWNKFKGFRDFFRGTWEVIKSIIMMWIDYWKMLWHAITFQWGKLDADANDIYQRGKNLGKSFREGFESETNQNKLDAIKKFHDEVQKSAGEAYAKLQDTQKAIVSLGWSKNAAMVGGIDSIKNIAKKHGWNQKGDVQEWITNKNTLKQESEGADKAASNSKATNINITIGKFQDQIVVHAASLKEGLDEIERKIDERFLAIINSGNRVAAQ